MTYRHIDVQPLSGRIGANVRGIDVAKDLGDDAFAEIYRAFLEHKVIAIRDQQLDHDQQITFAKRFGDPDIHPIAIGMDTHPEMIRVWKPADEPASFGTSWHTDNTFFDCPSKASVLYGVKIPPTGGDTLYASTEEAFETLSEPLQEMLDGLTAIHSASDAYDPAVTGEAKYRGEAAINYRMSEAIHEQAEHPVVRRHPETGRRGLFVNPMFTQRIVGLSERESRALLDLLYAHSTQPELTCRVVWEPGTLTVWDNRCTQHYAIDDYHGYERLMYRVTVKGDRPS